MTAGPATARGLGLVACGRCHLLCRQTGQPSACPRCGAPLHSRKPNGIARAWALVLAATIFYIPAMVLPITHTTSLGQVQSNTIMSGVIFFIQTGSWPVALVIFVASVFVPLLKLLILCLLLISVRRGWRWRPLDRTRLYRLTAAGVRGLGTLLSGAYIGVEPGLGGEPRRHFEGLEKQPMVTGAIQGRRYRLAASRLGSLNPAFPIYFRQIKVGQVVDYQLQPGGRAWTSKFSFRPPTTGSCVKTRVSGWPADWISI